MNNNFKTRHFDQIVSSFWKRILMGFETVFTTNCMLASKLRCSSIWTNCNSQNETFFEGSVHQGYNTDERMNGLQSIQRNLKSPVMEQFAYFKVNPSNQVKKLLYLAWRLVSSASRKYWKKLELWTESYIYILKIISSSELPCAIPSITADVSEALLSDDMSWSRAERYDSDHWSETPWIP